MARIFTILDFSGPVAHAFSVVGAWTTRFSVRLQYPRVLRMPVRGKKDLLSKISSQAEHCYLIAAVAFVYFLLFTHFFIPIFLPGDVTLCLLDATRMLRGQVIYREFFQITFPGSELVYFAFSRLFGPREWIPNTLLLLLGLGLTWISIAISRKVMRGWLPFLTGLLFLTCSLYNARDATHHWFSVLAVMATVPVVIERRSPRRLAVAGMLCGLASFFTQSRGVFALLGFVTFLVWEYRRQGQHFSHLLRSEAFLIGTFFVTVVFTNAYFIWKAGLTRFLYCTVVFVMRYYPAHSPADNLNVYLLSPPQLLTWRGLPWVLVYLFVHVLVPFVYLLFFMRYRQESSRHPEYPWDRLMLLNLTGLFLFFGVASAPSFFRLCTVSLPALILFVWFLSCPGVLEKVLRTSLWAFALMLAVAEPLRVQKHLTPCLDTPSGRVAFSAPDLYERYRWIRNHTQPSEFFYQADWADTYFVLGLRNPTPMSFITRSDYTRPEQVQDVMRALDEQPPRLVLWSVGLDYPWFDSSEADHLSPLRAYLRSHYRVLGVLPNGDQVWERKEQR